MTLAKKYDFVLKLAVILISISQPFILMLTQGFLWSISSYWNTPLQPLFIVVNAGTSYYFLHSEKWQVPAIFLLLLTAFSVEQYKLVHNIFAAGFFLSCIYPMLHIKRFRALGFLYLLSIPLFPLIGMLFFEIYCILIIGIYHLCILLYVEYLERNRNKLHEKLNV
jgi:hypothetical protein